MDRDMDENVVYTVGPYYLSILCIVVCILYSTGNSTQYSVMAYMGKESKKEWIHVYV